MSIKKIIVFVTLSLVIFGGVYITGFGIIEHSRFSGVERGFYNRPEDLADGLNIKGSIETVTKLLGSEEIKRSIMGLSIGEKSRRYYFALPLGYAENKNDQKYCVISAVDPKDVEALNSLLKSSPAPSDPNAPRFEFRGFVTNSPLNVQTSLTEYLREIYENEFYIYAHKNVSNNIAPYTIYVKTRSDDNSAMTITIGLIVTLVGLGLLIPLAARTYRKAHMYD